MNLLDNLMGPLGKEHCMIFYYLGLLNVFLAIFTLLGGIMMMFNNKSRNISLAFVMQAFILGFMYYLYRISYNICVKVL